MTAECLHAGILTVGGLPGPVSSAEIFNPKTGRSCKIGDLPVATYDLSLCGNLACGGHDSEYNCSRFDGAGTFTALSVTLREKRAWHHCWQLQTGEVLLLGGYDSTTERLSADGSSSTPDFDLPYYIGFVLNLITNKNLHCHCRYACGIELNGKFIVTGGSILMQTVAEFTETGQVTYLADLQEGRYDHACSKFVDNNGETVSFNQK